MQNGIKHCLLANTPSREWVAATRWVPALYGLLRRAVFHLTIVGAKL
jgi:hypothetical protein